MTDSRQSWHQRIIAEHNNPTVYGEFANWLSENGERHRAHFIRLQQACQIARPVPESAFVADMEADHFFVQEGHAWHLPISKALGFDLDTIQWNWRCRWFRQLADGTTERQLGGSSIGLEISENSGCAARFCFENGVVDSIQLKQPLSRPSFDLHQLLSLEPIQSLSFSLGTKDLPHLWELQSSELLNQIRQLTLCLDEEDLEHASSVASQVILDQHFCNVRDLNILAGGFGMETIEKSVLSAIRGSTFFHNLESLSLSSIDPSGMLTLFENVECKWSELFLDGGIGHEGLKAMINTGLTNHLETLMIRSIGWDNEYCIEDSALRLFCEYSWPKLRRLDLPGQALSSKSLDDLSTAPFISQLEHLDLSYIPSLLSNPNDLISLQKLSDALDPFRLKSLCLTNTGLSHLPPFLKERFEHLVRI